MKKTEKSEKQKQPPQKKNGELSERKEKRVNPAFARELVSNSQNQAAAKAIRSFGKQELGRNFDKRSYFNVLSNSMRAYLATLINPFEMQTLKKSAGIPVAPTVPSRKYACFARGVFSTVPRDLTAAPFNNLTDVERNELLSLTESNSGYIMVAPKLFGVSTKQTQWVRNRTGGLTQGGAGIGDAGALSSSYTLCQQPVVYTVANTKAGAPARFFEVNPTQPGELLPQVWGSGPGSPVGIASPGLGLFTVPDIGTETVASRSLVPHLASNLARASSNSDVNWWEVMPPDPYTPDTGLPVTSNGSATNYGALSVGYVNLSGAGMLLTRKYRMVACGLRIQYIGTEVFRGGQVIGLREPGGYTMASGSYGGIFATQPLTQQQNESGTFNGAMVVSGSAWPAAPANSSAVPSHYEVAPGFRTADWRVFGANPAAPFGCDTTVDVAPFGTHPWMSTPFDTRFNPDDTYGFDQMAAFDQGVPGDVERCWDELVYYPIDPSNAQYEHLYQTCTVAQAFGRGSRPYELGTPGAMWQDVDKVFVHDSVDATPHPPKEKRAGGFVTYNGRAMKVSDACQLLSQRLNKNVGPGALPVKEAVGTLQTLSTKESASFRDIHKLGDAGGNITFYQSMAGQMNVNLGVSHADNDWGYSLGWYVRGADDTTPVRFAFEVVGHYEIIGKDIRGQTAGAPPDPVGIAAMGSLTGNQLTRASTSAAPKLNVTAAASNVVQAVANQSGAKVEAPVSTHQKIMQAANAVPGIVNKVSDTVSTVSDTVGEVMEFVEPILGFLAALF